MTLVPSTLFRFIKQMNCLTRSNASIKMTNIATKYIGNNGWRNSDFNRRFIFSHATEDYIKLMGKDLHVNPGFGVLHANGTVDLLIKPTNPQEYPDADRAFINIYGLPTVSCEGINVELIGELKDVLVITATPESSKIFCEVQIPIKYDLDVKLLDDASVQILGMEADEVNVSTVNGEINTHGLKSHNIHVNTEHGHITSEGTMQGNIFINAKTTKLKAKRLQGLILDIEAEELSTAVESSYMNQGQISAHRGDIIINNLHGCTDLLIKQGQVVITGFHGQISGFVGSGKVDVHVTDVTGNSTLHLNEGSLVLSVLENPRHDLEVTATSLDISKEIKSAGTTASGSSQTFNLVKNDNAEASILKATVLNGSAQVKYQDWFSTLGIKM
ncbi:protein FAM185A-like [Homarus americanus]|uniref:protein FAM185A-like n=1 Tax=Homarus americanus TaxID=6706 RepID=UPI001C44AA79|nr:protein FAM185A-like [Homarus americanus]